MIRKPPIGLIFAGMCLIWGSTFAMLKVGLDGTPPLFGNALRHILGSTILFIIIFSRRLPIPTDRESIKQYLIVGLMNFSLSYSLTYTGTQYIYSNISALIWASVPITTAITAHFALKTERITPMKALGIGVGFMGVAIIFIGYGVGENPNLLLGMTLVFCAVMAGTWPSVYLKRKPAKADAIVLAGVGTGIGGLTTLGISTLVERDLTMVVNLQNVVVIFYLAIFGTVIAWVSYYYLLKQIDVVKLSFVGFIAPIIAIFMGNLFLDEVLPITVYIGAAMVMLGIFLTDYRKYSTLISRKI